MKQANRFVRLAAYDPSGHADERCGGSGFSNLGNNRGQIC